MGITFLLSPHVVAGRATTPKKWAKLWRPAATNYHLGYPQNFRWFGTHVPPKKNCYWGRNLHNSQADPWMKPPSVIKLSTGLWSSLANVGSHWCRRWRHAWIEGQILPGDSENRKWAATKTTRQLNSVKTQRKIRTMVGSCKSSSWLVTLPNIIINQLGHVKQFNLQTTKTLPTNTRGFPNKKLTWWESHVMWTSIFFKKPLTSWTGHDQWNMFDSLSRHG